MKRYIVILVSLLLATQVVSAQEKVVESSANSAPAWIGVSQRDHIIVSAEHATLDGAKKQCLANIHQNIINSVAVNVSSQELSYDAQTMTSEYASVVQSYESRVETIAAKLPFIQGITLDKAEIYWKKIFNKAENTYRYELHAKYPFSTQERNALIAEYNKIEKEHTDKFQMLKDEFDTFTEVEFITRAVNDLRALHDYFIDQTRKNEAKALMDNYRKLTSAISIVPYYSTLGEIEFYLNLSGRRMVTSRRPTIKSEYATQIECSTIEDNLYRISYNYEYCQPEDDNKIEVSFQFGSGSVARHTFYFDVSKTQMEVVPFGQIELDVKMVNATAPEIGQKISCDQIAQIKGWLNLRSKQNTTFKVTGINVSFDGIRIRVNSDLNVEFEGKGSHKLSFDVESDSDSIVRKDGIATGTVTIVNKETRKSEEVRFNLPYKIIL